MEFDILPGEAFYGGAVMDGINQPYTQASERELDLTRNQTPNQMMPLLLSTAGRWVWNPDGMRICLLYTSQPALPKNPRLMRNSAI